MSDARKGRLIGQGRTAEVFEFGDGQVLKLFRAGWPEPWIRHEIDVARAVTHTGVPAPAFIDAINTDGRTGIVYERVSGPSMLQVLSRRPWDLFGMARLFARVHANIHRHIAEGLGTQADYLRHMIGRASALSPDEVAVLLRQIDALDRGARVVCHGDYHPDNVILSARGPVVIDWSSASSGSPVGDVARTVLLFRTGTLPPGMGKLEASVTQLIKRLFLAAYLHHYRAARPVDRRELDAWLGPVAAARLGEAIEGEEGKLLALVRRSGARGK